MFMVSFSFHFTVVCTVVWTILYTIVDNTIVYKYILWLIGEPVCTYK